MAYSREMEKLERQFAENPRRFAAPFADALRKNAEVDRALEVIRVGLELNPEYIPGSVILGRCYLDLGDDNGAEAAFSRVLDLDNENVIALKSLADIMERQGRNDEAVSFLTYLLDVDRSNDEAREQLARIEAEPAAAAPTMAAEPASASEESADTASDASPIFGSPPGDAGEARTVAAAVEEFLEPTALWEPPETMAEASISSWVEPTSAETIEPPTNGESLVEEQMGAEDVAPVEGLESARLEEDSDGAPYEEFVLEREEEIVLTSMVNVEYQVANDSEDLLEKSSAAATDETEAEDAASADEDVATDPVTSEVEAAMEAAGPSGDDAGDESDDGPVPEDEPESATVAEEEVEAVDDVAPTSALEDEAPFEWAMHVGEEREFHPSQLPHGEVHASDSYDAAIEGIAPVDEDVVDEEDAGRGGSRPSRWTSLS